MLTQRQLQLLRFISDYQQDHGVPPSFDEMRAALMLRSKSGIHRLISGLEERGYIRRLTHRARALEVVRLPQAEASKPIPLGPKAPNVIQVPFRRTRPEAEPAPVAGRTSLPMFGRIAAGTPIEALSEADSVVEVPSMMVGDGDHYVLEVVGDSMVEAGIFDGDLVVIRRTDTAETGEVVVALIEEREATLKRIRKRGGSIALESANPIYGPRIFHPHQVRVQGRLVGLLRRY